MLLEELKDKKIAILGFAKEGKDNFLALRSLFPEKTIAIFDEKETEKPDEKTAVFSGRGYLKRLREYHVVFKTPGITMKKVRPFASRGVIITSQTEVFFDNFKGLVVGVTGTKGKGTTATLIYQILKKAGLNVKLVGNIGRPVFLALLKSKPADIFVYELSSHQLLNLKKSPQISVFLNLFRDHLDYYKNFQEYKRAKESIAKYQSENDFFIYNSNDKAAREIAKKTKAKKIVFNRIPLKVKMNIKGDFNLLNAKAAFAVAKLFRIPEIKIKQTITQFKGLEHRLEYIGKCKGIDFFNDSMSTIPEVAIAALKALPKTATLIVGGSDKGSNYAQMAKEIIRAKIRTVIFLGQGASQSLLMELNGFGAKGKREVFITDSMRQAVRIAYQKTNKGEICLLSPGAASFNLFRDYKQRGNLFKKYVKMFGQRTS